MVHVKAPTPSRLTACAVLIALVAVCFVVRSLPGAAVFLPILLGLLAAELDRTGGVVAVRIVKSGGRLLPAKDREHLVEEWTDHVLSAGEAGMRPVGAALSILIFAAIRLAFRLRVRRQLAGFLGFVVLGYVMVILDALGPRVQGLRRGDFHLCWRCWLRVNLRVVTACPALPLRALLWRHGSKFRPKTVSLMGAAVWIVPLAAMPVASWALDWGLVAVVILAALGSATLGRRVGSGGPEGLEQFVRRVAGIPPRR